MTRKTLRTREKILAMVAAVAVCGEKTATADDMVQEPDRSGAAPTSSASPEERAVTPGEKRASRAVNLAGRFHGGLGQRSLFDSSVLGADLTGSLGMHIDNVDLYADLQVLFGSSEGLAVRQYRFGPSIDFEAVSRLRLGIGLSVGGTTVTRESTGGTMQAFSVGARAILSVDLVPIGERGAIYVLGQLSVDSAGTLFGSDHRREVPATALWGPSVALGAKF